MKFHVLLVTLFANLVTCPEPKAPSLTKDMTFEEAEKFVDESLAYCLIPPTFKYFFQESKVLGSSESAKDGDAIEDLGPLWKNIFYQNWSTHNQRLTDDNYELFVQAILKKKNDLYKNEKALKNMWKIDSVESYLEKGARSTLELSKVLSSFLTKPSPFLWINLKVDENLESLAASPSIDLKDLKYLSLRSCKSIEAYLRVKGTNNLQLSLLEFKCSSSEFAKIREEFQKYVLDSWKGENQAALIMDDVQNWDKNDVKFLNDLFQRKKNLHVYLNDFHLSDQMVFQCQKGFNTVINVKSMALFMSPIENNCLFVLANYDLTKYSLARSIFFQDLTQDLRRSAIDVEKSLADYKLHYECAITFVIHVLRKIHFSKIPNLVTFHLNYPQYLDQTIKNYFYAWLSDQSDLFTYWTEFRKIFLELFSHFTSIIKSYYVNDLEKDIFSYQESRFGLFDCQKGNVLDGKSKFKECKDKNQYSKVTHLEMISIQAQFMVPAFSKHVKHFRNLRHLQVEDQACIVLKSISGLIGQQILGLTIKSTSGHSALANSEFEIKSFQNLEKLVLKNFNYLYTDMFTNYLKFCSSESKCKLKYLIIDSEEYLNPLLDIDKWDELLKAAFEVEGLKILIYKARDWVNYFWGPYNFENIKCRADSLSAELIGAMHAIKGDIYFEKIKKTCPNMRYFEGCIHVVIEEHLIYDDLEGDLCE